MDGQYKEHPTPTGWLVGGQLVPAPGSLDANVTVWLALPPEPGEPQIWEGLAAHRGTIGDRVELRAVPLFAYHVNYGDEVTVVTSGEGPLVATGISKDAGNYTFRVWLESGDEAAFRDVVTRFGQMGCLIEGFSGCHADHTPPRRLRPPWTQVSGRASSSTRSGVSERPDVPRVAQADADAIPCRPGSEVRLPLVQR